VYEITKYICLFMQRNFFYDKPCPTCLCVDTCIIKLKILEIKYLCIKKLKLIQQVKL